MTAAPMYPRMYRMAIFELNWFKARCEAAPPAALLLLLFRNSKKNSAALLRLGDLESTTAKQHVWNTSSTAVRFLQMILSTRNS